MTLSEIAYAIRRNWKNPYFGAVPYIDAMTTLTDMSSVYGLDDAKTIIVYFLANATTWKGEIARAIKQELKDRIK